MPFGKTVPPLNRRKRAQDRGECQKVALKMEAIQDKSFLPNEIGVDDPRRECQKVPFSAIFSRGFLGARRRRASSPSTHFPDY
jgi:hypothetical protein